jgi:hypothetical protein
MARILGFCGVVVEGLEAFQPANASCPSAADESFLIAVA